MVSTLDIILVVGKSTHKVNKHVVLLHVLTMSPIFFISIHCCWIRPLLSHVVGASPPSFLTPIGAVCQSSLVSEGSEHLCGTSCCTVLTLQAL